MSGRVAILGVTGMLGQALRTGLTPLGYDVAGIARTNADFAIDATDSALLTKSLDEFRPDLLINAAALTSLDGCEKSPGAAYQLNARLVADLAQYGATHGCRLVHISTDHFFSGDGARLHDESAPVALVNEYARTKYAGEAFAATCPDHLIIRTNLVGFRGWPGRPTFVEWALKALEAAEPMTLFEDFFTSSLDTPAFVSALSKLLTLDARGLLNVAAREASSKQTFVMGLARRLNLSTHACRAGSVRGLAGAPRADSLGLDVRKAEKILADALPDTNAVLDALARQYEERKK